MELRHNPSNKSDDIELFEQCLAQRKDFCSKVDAVKIFENGKYEIITALSSVINRLEAQKKTSATTRQDKPGKPFQSQMHTKLETVYNVGRQGTVYDNLRGNSRNCIGDISRFKLNGKKFDGIDDLRADIEHNYKGSEVGNRYDDKYIVMSVGEGTFDSIKEQLGSFSRTEIVYLILEKSDG